MMDRKDLLKRYIQEYWLILAGVLIGAVAGYLYYFFVGCAGGTCAITSKPINSTLYGTLMGGLFASLFKNNKRTNS